MSAATTPATRPSPASLACRVSASLPGAFVLPMTNGEVAAAAEEGVGVWGRALGLTLGGGDVEGLGLL